MGMSNGVRKRGRSVRPQALSVRAGSGEGDLHWSISNTYDSSDASLLNRIIRSEENHP